MNIILPASSSHWYFKSGKPCYEVANASRPGQMRRPTVVDAEKLSLVPSVTSILNVVSKPGLEAWKGGQYVLSALTLPKRPGESADAFANRVVRDARIEGESAADFGTSIHALAEGYLEDRLPSTVSSHEMVFLDGFMAWCQEHKVERISTEQYFAWWEEGYGGRTDFVGYIDGVFVVTDWKTQKTKPWEPVKWYPEWPVQLEAYKRGVEAEDALTASCVISSTEPGRVEYRVYEQADWHWRCFASARNIWYSPMGPGARLKPRSLDLEFKHVESEEFYVPYVGSEESSDQEGSTDDN